jgi:hypothetical protein
MFHKQINKFQIFNKPQEPKEIYRPPTPPERPVPRNPPNSPSGNSF